MSDPLDDLEAELEGKVPEYVTVTHNADDDVAIDYSDSLDEDGAIALLVKGLGIALVPTLIAAMNEYEDPEGEEQGAP